MRCVLDDQAWALAVGLGVDVDGDRLRVFGVDAQGVGQPAEPWAFVFREALVEAVDISIEIGAAEAVPAAPGPAPLKPMDRDLHDAANEKVLAAEHAEIRRQEITVEAQRGVGLLVAGVWPGIGRLAGEVHDAVVPFAAAGALPIAGEEVEREGVAGGEVVRTFNRPLPARCKRVALSRLRERGISFPSEPATDHLEAAGSSRR